MRGPATRPWNDCRGKEPWHRSSDGMWVWYWTLGNHARCEAFLPEDVYALLLPTERGTSRGYRTRADALLDLARAYRLARGEE